MLQAPRQHSEWRLLLPALARSGAGAVVLVFQVRRGRVIERVELASESAVAGGGDGAVLQAIGGSTNAPIHVNAIARHIGVELTNDDWEKIGYELPLLVNLQPAGEYLAEEYYRAGGLPAVVAELVKKGKIKDAITVNGRNLLAFDAGIDWDIKRVEGASGMMGGGLFNTALNGTGWVAIVDDGGADMPSGGSEGDGEADPMYDQAVAIVLQNKKASI